MISKRKIIELLLEKGERYGGGKKKKQLKKIKVTAKTTKSKIHNIVKMSPFT